MRHFHFGKVYRILRTEFGVTVCAFAPDAGDLFGNFLVGCAAADETLEIVSLDGEQARIQFSLGR